MIPSRPPPGGPGPAGLPPPLPATVDRLVRELEHKPVLWVGAGASIAAGYPSTARLVEAMAAAAEPEDGLDPSWPFPRVADAFVASRGGGSLDQLLHREIGREALPPTAFHEAVARLAGAGCFSAVLSTNYDDLLERALRAQGVPCLVQTLEANAALRTTGDVRVVKLHGSQEDWRRVVLTGRSYQDFGERYGFLVSQLEVLLRQNPVLFAGCSLQDPRLLEWLWSLSDEAAGGLHALRALLTPEAWAAACAFTWEGRPAAEAFGRANLRAVLLDSHDHLPDLFTEAARRLAPPAERVELTIEVGDRWRFALPGVPSWETPDPLADGSLEVEIAGVRALGNRALPTDASGCLAPEAAHLAALVHAAATRFGDRLTTTLLSPEAQERLLAVIRAAQPGHPPWFVVQVGTPAPGGEEAERRADRALALPWELLRLEDRFPLEAGTLDLAREALVPGRPGLGPPDRALAVVGSVAAPVDQPPLNLEDEMFRLAQALAAAGHEERLVFTDLGTADELQAAVEWHQPPVVHFMGHGLPGALVFEDELAAAKPEPVRDLLRRFQEVDAPPRLFYLSACHGATTGSGLDGPPFSVDRIADPALGATPASASAEAAGTFPPSTAASLHRAGFPQVVAFFGPVGDAQATRNAAAFYAALAAGRTAREALRRVRRLAVQPLSESGRAAHLYPLGWAQLAYYHRGQDGLTALAPRRRVVGDPLKTPRARELERLGESAGAHTGPSGLTGVQRLRFGFVGRRGQRSELLRRFDQGERLLVVQGLGGLGKTALCAEVVPLLARRLGRAAGKVLPILPLDGRHAGAQPDPIAALWRQVEARDRTPEWSATLAALQEKGLTGRALAGAVRVLAQAAGGLVVYLDDAESLQVPLEDKDLGRWLSEELRAFWERLQALCGPRFRVLVSSRYVPEGTPGAAVLALPPLHDYELVRLMGWLPALGLVPFADREWLASQIDGHPRTVEYLEELVRLQVDRVTALGPGATFSGDWRREILEAVLPETRERVDANLLLGKVWAALSAGAQDHLGRCSVLTAPAPREAIVELEPEPGTTGVLERAGLLSPFDGLGRETWWAPHRLVAEEARARWQGDEREAHRSLGRWFAARTEPGPHWNMRAIEHLSAAGAGDEAWPAALRLVGWLRAAGRYREALSWVERVLAAEPTGSRLGMALTFEAHLARLAGTFGAEATGKLERALTVVGPADAPFVLYELGSQAQSGGRLRDAAEYFQQALGAKRALVGELHAEVAAMEHNLAGVLQAQGDLAGARQRLERALQISAKVFGTEEHPEVAASLHSLAGVLQAQGDLAGARQRLERVLEIEGRIYGTREHYSTAMTEAALGILLRQLGEHQRASELLTHAYGVFQRQLGPDHPTTRNLAQLFESTEGTASATP